MSKISTQDAEQYEKFLCTARQSGISSLGGKVDMRDFTNLKEFEISNHGITELKNYPAEQLEIFRVFNNNIQDELPPFGENIRDIKIFNDDMFLFRDGSARRKPSNRFSGNLREILAKCKDSLRYFEAHSHDNVPTKNDLSGLLPELSEYKNLTTFKIAGNKNVVGRLGNLSGLNKLIEIDVSGTSITDITGDFDIPDFASITEFYEPAPRKFRHFKLYNTPLSSTTLDKIIDKIYAKATVAYNNGHEANELANFIDMKNPQSSVEIGPAHLLSDSTFTKLGTMRGTYKMKVKVHVDSDHLLLDNPFASDCDIAISTKKLKATSSKAMTIRRGVDDVTADLYYDNDGNLTQTSEIHNASNGKTYANANEFLNESVLLNPRLTISRSTSHDKITNTGPNAFSTSTNADGSSNFKAEATTAAGTGNGRVVMKLDTPIAEKDHYRTRFKLSGDVVGFLSASSRSISIKPNNSSAAGNAGGSWSWTLTSPKMTLGHVTATVDTSTNPINTDVHLQAGTASMTRVYIDNHLLGDPETVKVTTTTSTTTIVLKEIEENFNLSVGYKLVGDPGIPAGTTISSITTQSGTTATIEASQAVSLSANDTFEIHGDERISLGDRVTGTNIEGSSARIVSFASGGFPSYVEISGSHPNLTDGDTLTFSHGFNVGDRVAVSATEPYIGAEIRAINVNGDKNVVRYSMGDYGLVARNFIEYDLLRNETRSHEGVDGFGYSEIVSIDNIIGNVNVSATGAFSQERFGANEVLEPGRKIINEAMGGFVVPLDYISGTPNIQEFLEIKNFKLEAIKHSATIVKWYDQTNNGNDFEQTSANYQPEIAHDGKILDAASFGLARNTAVQNAYGKVNGAVNNSTTLSIDGMASGFILKPGMFVYSGTQAAFPNSDFGGGDDRVKIDSITSGGGDGDTVAVVELDRAVTINNDGNLGFGSLTEGESFMEVVSTGTNPQGFSASNTGEYSICTNYRLLNSDYGWIACNAGAASNEGSGLYASSGTVTISNGTSIASATTTKKDSVASNAVYTLVCGYYNDGDATITENGDDGTSGEDKDDGYNFISSPSDERFMIGNRNGVTNSESSWMSMQMKECLVFGKDKGTRTTSGLKYNQAIETTIMEAHGITSEA